jgi:hypothetical protein
VLATRLTEMLNVRYAIMLAGMARGFLAENRTASILEIAWFEPV